MLLRKYRLVVGILRSAVTIGLLAMLPCVTVAADIPDFTGVWAVTSPRSANGANRPALTAKAQASLDAFDPLDDPVIRCVMPGFPRGGLIIYPFEIVQTDELLVFLYETFGMVRRIHMDGRQRPDFLPPSRMGYSVGRWEDDELVINTTNIAPGLLSGGGVYQFGDVTVVERYRLVDDGRGLEGEVIVTAPETFVEPWRRTFTWALDPDGIIFEEYCDPRDSRF